MKLQKLRLGIIGTNKISDKFAMAAGLLEELEIKSVYSRNEETAEVFANRHCIPLMFTNLTELATCSEIDAVYIASPNSFHAEQAILLMDSGKHVLCEKPMASNSKQVNEMIEAASRNRVILMEAMMTTHHANFKNLENNIHKLGKLRRYFGNYCQYSSRYDAYKEGEVLNAFKPELSNGSLMDIGVYCIHPMVQLFGKPNSIKANALMLESGVDGEGSILFEYDDMLAIAMYSKISDSLLPSEIQGENGSLIIEQINNFNRVKLSLRNGSEEDLSEDQPMDTMYYEISDFVEWVKNNDFERASYYQQVSMHSMECMDEVRRQIGLVYPADCE